MTPEELIEAEEGFVPYGYSDSEGYLTIGIGTLIDKRSGGGITLEEARYLMGNRLAPIYAALDARLHWWRDMSEARRNALVSMAYQLGIVGLLKFKAALAAMEGGDYALAARRMLVSLWARQTPERAKRAARAMLDG